MNVRLWIGLCAAALLVLGGCEAKKEDESKKTEAAEGEGAEGEGAEGAEGAEGEAEGEGEGAAAAEPTGDPITIQPETVAVDTVKTGTETQVTDAKVTPPGAPEAMPVAMTRTKKEVEKVLAVSDGDPVMATKVEVTLEDSETGTVGGKPKEGAKPWHGKTYIVDNTSGSLVVTTADGGTVVGEELEGVTKKYRNMGKVNPMEEAAVGKPLQVGQEVDVDWEAAATFLADEDGMQVTNPSMKLASVKDGIAYFDVALTMEGSDGAISGKTGMKGQFGVDVATGRMVSTTMDGSLDMANEVKPGVVVKIVGTMKVEETITYE